MTTPKHVRGTIHRAADLDADYERAIGIMVRANRVSTSFVSRSMGIGYNAAARLVDRAEADGIVTRPNEVGKRSLAAIQPDPAPVASEPVAWQRKPLPFDWHPKDRGNPSEVAINTDDYTAYVLIPYESGHDPSAGVGTWNGVANWKGKSGFPTKEAAMRYCEDTIRNDVDRDIKNALRWIAAPSSAPASVAEAVQKRIEKALNDIRELNMSGADEDGHRWANSDLIDQSVTEGLVAMRALSEESK